MLQNLGACNGALFVDMADDKHGDPLSLGKLHQCHGTVLDLTDAPEYTNAGTYTVYAKVSRANYNDWVGAADLPDVFPEKE